MHHHHGRLRTAGLLAFLFAMVLMVGAIVAYSMQSPAALFIFAGIGLISVALLLLEFRQDRSQSDARLPGDPGTGASAL